MDAGQSFVKPAQCCQVVVKPPTKHAIISMLILRELTSPEIVAYFIGFRAGTIYSYMDVLFRGVYLLLNVVAGVFLSARRVVLMPYASFKEEYDGGSFI